MNIYKHFTANGEQLQPFPFRRELAMQAYLIENQGILGLNTNLYSSSSVEIIDEELSIVGGRKSRETDGRIDILAMYSGECVAVVELKLGELQNEHLIQLEDYLVEKDQIITSHCKDMLGDDLAEAPKFIGILVGTTINPNLAEIIKNGYTTTKGIPIAALTVQRFRSEHGGVYATTDVYFSEPKSTKDTSKYLFDGTVYGKGRLVWAVLKKYSEEHPETTFAALEKVFPQSCQGKQGVFVESNQANAIFLEKGYRRHFIKPEELIRLADSTIAVSNQWGKGNVGTFLECAKKFYAIESA